MALISADDTLLFVYGTQVTGWTAGGSGSQQGTGIVPQAGNANHE